MNPTFLDAIRIRKVHHLENIEVPIASDARKHLILTGKNESGKTSVLDALADDLEFIVSDRFCTEEECRSKIESLQHQLAALGNDVQNISARRTCEKALADYTDALSYWTTGVVASCASYSDLIHKYHEGKFVLAYYRSNRETDVTIPKTIKTVDLQTCYALDDAPGKILVEYMVYLKVTQAFSPDSDSARQIDAWFARFENILRKVFDDDSLVLDFNKRSFQFTIRTKGRDPFDFNTMSAGYSALCIIITDLMMRMEKSRTDGYDLEGIVLIDELEAHLHLELQRNALPILTGLFPNVQFIVATHSPFVLCTASNAVVYDLENHTLCPDGLTNLPYHGIAEGWFKADLLSQELRKKYERYCELAKKDTLTVEEYIETTEIKYYLDKIPDYLAPDMMAEYQRLKLKLYYKVHNEGMNQENSNTPCIAKQ